MKIGCVKEIKNNEFRVGMTPDNVKSYTNAGHIVYIEKGAGEGSSFTDEEYKASGAVLMDTAKEIWDTCEMMIKVKEPLKEEYQYFHKDLILYTYLHLAADRPLTDALLSRSKGSCLRNIDGKKWKYSSFSTYESDCGTFKCSGRCQISGKAIRWKRYAAFRSSGNTKGKSCYSGCR